MGVKGSLVKGDGAVHSAAGGNLLLLK